MFSKALTSFAQALQTPFKSYLSDMLALVSVLTDAFLFCNLTFLLHKQ